MVATGVCKRLILSFQLLFYSFVNIYMSRAFVKEDDSRQPPIIPPRAALPQGTPNYVTHKVFCNSAMNWLGLRLNVPVLKQIVRMRLNVLGN